ncbi:RZZ complex, subunit Zw10 [Cordyceps fumosorosea ARSEF 2679]|uniref:RZZ complex, subunit Zw10 n=1 Tax=Cordyceps fumosorosea (strain ARSEF 2679) TaxID=1081104 RepID=A0A167P7Z6_CORFA|nr:RZZ complex, subunit Zw10 [Cordyceps fumosorosea ARSEF 2679]OAA56382.1 RZZ complex, subunit Zw10 [Cordyceps fumosorosea ARSEF 2679]
MAAAMEPIKIADAIMAFALSGRFPEDADALPPLSGTDLQPAIDSLNRAAAELETEIHQINEETKDDVTVWAKNAKSLQEDIIRSKTMANEITRQSEAPDVSGEAISDAEEKIEFINREVQYSHQLHQVLRSLKRVSELLNQVEHALADKRILESLRFLEESWAALDNVNAPRSCRAMRLLDIRAFELKSSAYQVFDQIWKSMVNVDVDASKIIIRDTYADGRMSLADSVIGLKAFKEVDERLEQLWHNLNSSIVSPRMDFQATSLKSISADVDELSLSGTADHSIDNLLTDLETIFVFVAKKLPADLLPNFSSQMVADVIPKLLDDWLDTIVPSSLQNMDTFQHAIQRTEQFCTTLNANGYTGLERISTWAEKAPMTWLGKCRDTALDGVRNRLAGGIGAPKQVEKIEKHMVTIAEGKELATTGAGAAADTTDWNEDWGDAWNEEDPTAGKAQETDNMPADDDDGTDAWGGWGESADHAPEATAADAAGDDDGADAWGWDDDAAAEPEPAQTVQSTPAKSVARPKPRGDETRELILKETYSISSMPELVLELISSILDDGMILTKEDGAYNLVAGTAPGLFGLPTFALALFRAISPHYYSLVEGGNMYLYNDAMYLAEKLGEFSANWKEREDVTPRAKAMLRLDNDIKTLRSFANRSYAAEMSIQRTILGDLLGDSQSLLQQDEMESAVEAGTTRIRTMASTWEPILARSVWSQAIGSLADTMASRLISDVLEMSSIGQDDAYSIAKLISTATELDDLFLPSKLGDTAPSEDEVPTTAQYAPNWLRLKYLSEVLQSNLNEVKYLWCDSELSLYFTVDEVVDLIRASFEENARTRDTIREIRAKKPLSA